MQIMFIQSRKTCKYTYKKLHSKKESEPLKKNLATTFKNYSERVAPLKLKARLVHLIWTCFREKKDEFATLFQKKMAIKAPCSRQNAKWLKYKSIYCLRLLLLCEQTNERKTRGAKFRSYVLTVCRDRPCSRIKSKDKCTLFQRERVIFIPCSRVRGKKHTLLNGTHPYSSYMV